MAETETKIAVCEWGEDGDWLMAKGHVDLDEFVKAADAYVLGTWYPVLAGWPSKPASAEELPSGWDVEAGHTWYRPIEWADLEEEAKRYGWTPEQRGRVLADRLEEEWKHRCTADDPRAEPWTEIRA